MFFDAMLVWTIAYESFKKVHIVPRMQAKKKGQQVPRLTLLLSASE